MIKSSYRRSYKCDSTRALIKVFSQIALSAALVAMLQARFITFSVCERCRNPMHVNRWWSLYRLNCHWLLTCA